MPGSKGNCAAAGVEAADDHHNDGDEIGNVNTTGGESENGAERSFGGDVDDGKNDDRAGDEEDGTLRDAVLAIDLLYWTSGT